VSVGLKMDVPVQVDLSECDSLRSVPRTVAGGRFEVRELLGSGSFGAVHRGVDKRTGAQVALKFEAIGTGMLASEAAVLRKVQRGERQGFVRLHFVGAADCMRCMVTDLLECSLEDRFERSGRKFDVVTTVLLAQQVLGCMEYLHSTGFVHRDIKPDNIMTGTKGRQHHVYLIDFGLAERYYKWRRHEPMRSEAFQGTVRYASVSAMRGVSQSRRDDLESVGYMLVYFLRGTLPWSGLPAKGTEERFRKVREKKARMSMRELCGGYPRTFEKYLTQVRTLSYAERPDYASLQKYFADCRSELQETTGRAIHDHGLQWMKHTANAETIPLQPPEEVCQPDDDKPRLGLFAARLCGRAGSGRGNGGAKLASAL